MTKRQAGGSNTRKRASKVSAEPRMGRAAEGGTNGSAVDLVVIGAGSGGMSAALGAARHGASVVLVERDTMGGTCVNRGCVPKKMLSYGANLAGILSSCLAHKGLREDWSDAIVRVNAEVARLQVVFTERLQQAGVRLIRGEAVISAADTVQVDGQPIRARHILLATGARPRALTVPGGDLASTSDDIFSWRSLPGSIAVVGGGYIAVEQASILARFGVKVHMLVREDRVLTKFDQDLSTAIADAFTARGIQLHFNVDVTMLNQSNGAIEVCYRDNAGSAQPAQSGARTQSLRVQAVLAAIGRDSHADGLGLDALGVKREKPAAGKDAKKKDAAEDAGQGDERRDIGHEGGQEGGQEASRDGEHDGGGKAAADAPVQASGPVQVDRQFRTSLRSVYAIGDAIAGKHLTPVAVAQGKWLADRLFGRRGDRADMDIVPTAVFSDPAIGSVGMTEAEAIEDAGKPERIATDVRRFVSLENRYGGLTQSSLVKLVYNARSGRVLGAHMMDNAAPEIIQALAVALRLGVRISHLKTTLQLHPTVAEEFFA